MIESLHPFTSAIGEWWCVAIALVLFLVVLVVAEGLQRYTSIPVEFSRKFVHVCSGLIVATFPWFFDSFLSVLAIGVVMGAFLVMAKKFNWFPSLHGVERQTAGDIYYLLAILFLFLFAKDYPVFYLISVLVLVVSDSLAAILGSTYQHITYRVEKQKKSLEGSAVFFVSTFLIVHLPLLLMTDTGRKECVLIALLLAIIVTLLEAVCIYGSDNLVIPIISFMVLIECQFLPVERLIVHLLWQVITLTIVNIINLRSEFIGTSGIIGAHLFLYGSFALGDPYWVVVPTMALATFILLMGILTRKFAVGVKNIYQIVAFFYITLVPMSLLFVHNLFERILLSPPQLSHSSSFYILFISAIATHLAMALFRLLRCYYSGVSPTYLTLLSLGGFSYGLLIPLGIHLLLGHIDLLHLSLPALVIFVGVTAFFILQRKVEDPDKFPLSVRLQTAGCAIGVLVGLPFYLWHRGIIG